jgi:AraC family transcriptional regulator
VDSRVEYELRMHRVLRHIDAHLDAALDLATLAAVAHFSAFHFHRLFAAWMGETLGEYLRRRRVEMAAMRLAAQPRLPILNAALSAGFGSGEAFSRAFKAHFGCSPSAWRARQVAGAANRNFDQVHGNPDQDVAAAGGHHGTSFNARSEVAMKVTLIDREAARVVYLRYTGPYGDPIARFWGETVYPWMVTHGLLGQPRYGVSHDDPDITDRSQCRYDAGVELPADYQCPRNMLTTTIPGGRYAAMPFNGDAREIEDVWRRLLRDWLPSSGLQLDARPCFEYYARDASYDQATGAFSCDLCIPVAPL